MKFEKDYYHILEISPLADAAAIKKAYRQLAHRYHPDKNPDSSFSEARFREVREAYEVLGQESLRASYDEWRWLTGKAYKKTRLQPTAAWLIAQAKQLSVQVIQLETYQIQQRLLFDYLNFLLSDVHLAVLKEGSEAERAEFLKWLLTILPRLAPPYLPGILERAQGICDEADCPAQLLHLQRQVMKEAKWQRIKPLVLLGIVLALLLFMYLWTGSRQFGSR